MQFMAPAVLLGLLAAVLPFLIHRIGRRRAQPVRFAAMQLLLRSERQVHARKRLREIVLLILRTSLAASLPFLFARPYTLQTTDLPVVTLDAQAAVIILDDSASMGRTWGRGTLFSLAKDRAQELVRHMPSESELAFLVTSEGSAPRIGVLEPDRSRVLSALGKTTGSFRPANFTLAMEQATALLSTSERAHRRIYLFTDLQATGWENGVGFSGSHPPEVIVDDVSAGTLANNRAVVSLEVAPAPEAGPAGIAVTAEIVNYSQEAISSLPVSLLADGTTLAKGTIELPKNGRARKRFLHVFPEDSGASHDIAVAIAGDDLPFDDQRLTHVELLRSLRLLIINGDPRTVRNEDEPFFFQTALQNALPSAFIATKLADDVSQSTLEHYTAVALLNVAEPPLGLTSALRTYVEEGGGLFISVGDRVNTAVWNQRLGDLLPQPLSLLRTAAAPPGKTMGELVDDRPAERLLPVDGNHPILGVFSDGGQGLLSARFFRYLLLEPVRADAQHQVVLRYESGAPALVERDVGRGRVILLTTTVDREWTDLAIRPGYLPLIRECVRRLLGENSAPLRTALFAGEVRTLRFPGDARSLEVVRPDGTAWVAQREQADANHTLRFTHTEQLGSYKVHVGGAEKSKIRTSQNFVVNADPRESNPARLSKDRRPDRIAQVTSGAAPPKHRVEWWHLGSAGLLFVLLAESLLTMRKRGTVA